MLLAGYAEGVTYLYINCKTYYRKEGLGEQKYSFGNLNPTFVPNCRNEETFFSYCTQATIKFDDLLSKLESELNTVKETLKQKIERNNQLLQDTNDLIYMLEEKEKELQKKQSEITKLKVDLKEEEEVYRRTNNKVDLESICSQIVQLPRTQEIQQELLKVVQELGWTLSPNVVKPKSMQQKGQTSQSKHSKTSTGGMTAIRNKMDDLQIDISRSEIPKTKKTMSQSTRIDPFEDILEKKVKKS
jgi:hypothetical protein